MVYTVDSKLDAILHEMPTDVTLVIHRGPAHYEEIGRVKGRPIYRLADPPGGAGRIAQYMADLLRVGMYNKTEADSLKVLCKKMDHCTVSVVDLPEDVPGKEETPPEKKYTVVRLDSHKLNYDKLGQVQWDGRHNVLEDVILSEPEKITPQDIIDAESAYEYMGRAFMHVQKAGKEIPIGFSHDYQTSGVNTVVRRLLEKLGRSIVLAHYEHTTLPSPMGHGVFRSIERYDGADQGNVFLEYSLNNDVYFVQTEADADRFIRTLHEYLPEGDVTIQHRNVNGFDLHVVRYKDHDTWVAAVPASVDPKDLRKKAMHWKVRRESRGFRSKHGISEDTDIGHCTDRGGEWTKYVLPKLMGIREYKTRNLHAKIIFNQQCDPSRQEDDMYRTRLDDIRAGVADINTEFPGLVVLDACRYPLERLLHRHRVGNFLLITSVDGQNLVAKEGAALADLGEPTVIIISKYAGAAEQLGKAGAIVIDPFNEESIIGGLEQAVNMPYEERLRRANSLRKAVETEDLYDYTCKIFSTIAERRNEMLAAKGTKYYPGN